MNKEWLIINSILIGFGLVESIAYIIYLFKYKNMIGMSTFGIGLVISGLFLLNMFRYMKQLIDIYRNKDTKTKPSSIFFGLLMIVILFPFVIMTYSFYVLKSGLIPQTIGYDMNTIPKVLLSPVMYFTNLWEYWKNTSFKKLNMTGGNIQGNIKVGLKAQKVAAKFNKLHNEMKNVDWKKVFYIGFGRMLASILGYTITTTSLIGFKPSTDISNTLLNFGSTSMELGIIGSYIGGFILLHNHSTSNDHNTNYRPILTKIKFELEKIFKQINIIETDSQNNSSNEMQLIVDEINKLLEQSEITNDNIYNLFYNKEYNLGHINFNNDSIHKSPEFINISNAINTLYKLRFGQNEPTPDETVDPQSTSNEPTQEQSLEQQSTTNESTPDEPKQEETVEQQPISNEPTQEQSLEPSSTINESKQEETVESQSKDESTEQLNKSLHNVITEHTGLTLEHQKALTEIAHQTTNKLKELSQHPEVKNLTSHIISGLSKHLEKETGININSEHISTIANITHNTSKHIINEIKQNPKAQKTIAHVANNTIEHVKKEILKPHHSTHTKHHQKGKGYTTKLLEIARKAQIERDLLEQMKGGNADVIEDVLLKINKNIN